MGIATPCCGTVRNDNVFDKSEFTYIQERGGGMNKRIWELDAARGLCILGMLLVHLIFDMQSLFQLDILQNSFLYGFVAEWGGVLFFLISGICATLGSRPVRRGLVVLACGLVVSAVTCGMYHFQFAGKSMIIYFGVLHCLGSCMLLWPLFRRLPWPILAGLGALLIAIGFSLTEVYFPTGLWLLPLGLKYPGFASSDYFPLLPYLGFFFLGAVLGKTLYKNKQTKFPKVSPEKPLVRGLSFFGKWSLPIYMLHQPVFTGILAVLEVIL